MLQTSSPDGVDSPGVCGSFLTLGVVGRVEGDHISLSATRGWVREAVTVVAARLSAVERAPPSAPELARATEPSALLTECVH